MKESAAIIPTLELADESEPPSVISIASQQARMAPSNHPPTLGNRVGNWILGKVLRKIVAVLLLLPLGGFGLLFMQWMNGTLPGGSEIQPQTLSCAELIEKGPGENRHVILTDYRLELDQLAADRGFLQENTWRKAWVQAVPIDAGRQPVRLLIETDQVTTSRELLLRLQESGSIQGIVRQGVRSPRSREERAVEKGFPKADLKNCLVLMQGETPLKNYMLFSLAIVLIVLGVLLYGFLGWLVWPRRAKASNESEAV